MKEFRRRKLMIDSENSNVEKERFEVNLLLIMSKEEKKTKTE